MSDPQCLAFERLAEDSRRGHGLLDALADVEYRLPLQARVFTAVSA